VQNGKLAAWAFALDKQLNNVDFPTLGKPTIPHLNAILYSFEMICKGNTSARSLHKRFGAETGGISFESINFIPP
jgi:hypothetical protein